MPEMSTLREAAQQALEALWHYHATEWGADSPASKAINALQAALARQEDPSQSLPIRATVFDDAHPNGIPLEQWVRSGNPPQRKPLTWAERLALWRNSTFRGNGGRMDWFIEGTRAAERAHGIKE